MIWLAMAFGMWTGAGVVFWVVTLNAENRRFWLIAALCGPGVWMVVVIGVAAILCVRVAEWVDEGGRP